MLSKEVLGLIQSTIQKFTFLQILPCCWDNTKNQLSIKSKFVEKLQYYFQVTSQILLFTPVFLFGPKACREKSSNIAEIVMPVLEIICICNCIIFQIGFYVYRYEIVCFVNTFLKFEVSQQRKFSLSFHPHKCLSVCPSVFTTTQERLDIE